MRNIAYTQLSVINCKNKKGNLKITQSNHTIICYLFTAGPNLPKAAKIKFCLEAVHTDYT